MQGKIALEEHFAIDDTLMDSQGYFGPKTSGWKFVSRRCSICMGDAIRRMDKFGIEMMILSLNAPAVQAIPDARKANDIARKANDYLADAVRKQPDALSTPCRSPTPRSRPRDAETWSAA